MPKCLLESLQLALLGSGYRTYSTEWLLNNLLKSKFIWFFAFSKIASYHDQQGSSDSQECIICKSDWRLINSVLSSGIIAKTHTCFVGSWQWKGDRCFQWPEVLLCTGEAAHCPFLSLWQIPQLFSSWLWWWGKSRAWLEIAWGIRDFPLRTGGRVMVPFKRKPKILSLSFVVSLGGSLSDNEGLRDTCLIPGSKGWSFSFLN